MIKNKSTWLVASLLCLAWGATFLSKDYIDGFCRGIRIEEPNWLFGGALGLSVPTAILALFALWLQRDNVGRTLATIAATASLLFCALDAQAIIWCLLKLNYFARQPGSLQTFGAELGIAILFSCIAFSLSALCFWLCVRAAGPKQPRPLASWRDWANWNAQSRRTESSNA